MKSVRKDIMEYEEAPSGAIKLYNYKEPFMPTKNGFGFQGVLMHDAEEQLIQCHTCGEWFKTLVSHVKKHGFSNVYDYKKEYGLSNSTALVCEEVRAKAIEQGRVLAKKLKGIRPKSGFKKGHKGGFKKSMEKRNNAGTCPLQLLDKLEMIKVELGYIPTCTKVDKLKTLNGKTFSGRGLVRSLGYVFGSWDNAVRQLHWTGVDKKTNRQWNKESLYQAYRDFVKTNKRFPSGSDCRRGVFPSKNSFSTFCGGMHKVKQELIDELLTKL